MPKNMNKKKNSLPARKTQKELTRLGGALRALGSLGGTALGGLIGQPAIGSGIGRSLGATVSKWLGSGDYSISRNSLLTQSASNNIPMMHKDNQSVVVRHKEYLGEIKGSTAFTTQQVYQLNPGNDYAFPWLSRIAANFQEYKLKGVIFHYIPTSGEVVSGSNPAIGSVMIQTSYRAADSDPSSKVEMLNEYWASEAKPCEAFCHPIECAPDMNPFKTQYVRTGAVPAGDNILFYDLGRTVVCTSGMPADNNVVGDLWISYEIELTKPVLSSPVNSPIEYAVWSSLTPVVASLFNNVSPILTGNFPCDFAVNTITFPKGSAGTYTIVLDLVASTNYTDANLSGAPTLVSMFAAPWGNRDGTTTYATVTGGANDFITNAFRTDCITILDPQAQATFTYPVFTVVGILGQVIVRITQVS